MWTKLENDSYTIGFYMPYMHYAHHIFFIISHIFACKDLHGKKEEVSNDMTKKSRHLHAHTKSRRNQCLQVYIPN